MVSTLGENRQIPSQRATPLMLAAAVVVGSLWSASAFAVDGVWTGTTSTNWSDTTAWSGGTVADGTGANADFNQANPTADLTITLDTAKTIGNMTFGDTDTSSVAGWNISGTNTLTLGGTSASTITANALGAGKYVTINAPVAGGFTKAGVSGLVLNNTANTGDIVVSAGTLYAANGSSYTNTLGSGKITLKDGTTLTSWYSSSRTWSTANPIQVDSTTTAATINTSNATQMNGAVTGGGILNLNVVTTTSRMDMQNNWTGFTGRLNFTGSGNVRLAINKLSSSTATNFSGAAWASTAVDLGGTVALQPYDNSAGNTIYIGRLSGASATASLADKQAGGIATWRVGALGGDSTYAGMILGSNAFYKEGSGTLTLTNSGNTYTGATTVAGGTLALGATASIAASTQINLLAGGILDTTARSFATANTQPLAFTLDGTGSGSAGFLNAGALDITNSVVSFATVGTLDDGVYVIGSYSSLTGSQFATVNNLPTGATIDYHYNNSNQIAVVVPEPASVALAFGGLYLIGLRRRRNA